MEAPESETVSLSASDCSILIRLLGRLEGELRIGNLDQHSSERFFEATGFAEPGKAMDSLGALGQRLRVALGEPTSGNGQ